MKRMFVFLTLLCCVTSMARVAYSLDNLHIGDPLKYSVRVPTADSVMVVEPSDIPVHIMPINQNVKPTGNSFEFSAAVYDTGSFSIPPLAVLLFTRGQLSDTVWTEPRDVVIEPLLPDSATTPHPIKPYEELPLRFADVVREYWPWALGAIALATLIFGWMKYRNRAKPGDEAPAPPPPPPADLAVRELIALRDKRYPERGMLKEQYSEFSEIMRRYVEGRYEFAALEMTTYELASELRRDDLPNCLRDDLLPVLRESDLVKFAKQIPNLAESTAIVELGFTIVEQTKPRLEEVKEVQSA